MKHFLENVLELNMSNKKQKVREFFPVKTKINIFSNCNIICAGMYHQIQCKYFFAFYYCMMTRQWVSRVCWAFWVVFGSRGAKFSSCSYSSLQVAIQKKNWMHYLHQKSTLSSFNRLVKTFYIMCKLKLLTAAKMKINEKLISFFVSAWSSAPDTLS